MVPPLPKKSLFPQINTLRFRISILYVAVIGTILIFFQVVLFINYANSVSREFDSQLRMKAEQIGGAVNTFREMLGDQREALTMAAQQAIDLNIEYPGYAFMSESPEKFWLSDAKKLGLDKDYLMIMGSQGGVIAKSNNVGRDLFQKIGKLKLNGRMFYDVGFNGSVLRFIMTPYYYAYKEGYLIVVGSPYGQVKAILWRHLMVILASSLVFLVIASLIVRIFVIRVLSSVMEISQVARNISQENLHKRILLTHADQEIEHLTGSLNNMIARLEKSFAHVKEFSLEMAHEVKTPLAIISGESKLALEKERTSQEYKETFKVILKEAKRTQKFVADLLLLTKLDYRLIKLRFEPLDLAGFIQEICGKMRFLSGPKGVVIREDIALGPMMLKGDKIHLRRVFFNLIDNALKFTPAGGHIDITARREGQKAIVMVSDTGCGISPEEIRQIFHKFHRGVDNEQGCGLGLSIAHSIIALHGGHISAQSEAGKGTSFRMEFPLLAQEHPDKAVDDEDLGQEVWLKQLI